MFRRAGASIGALAAVALTGCGGQQSSLDPHSRPARDITDLWWWMLVIAAIVLAGAVVLLVLSYVKRREMGLPFLPRAEGGLPRVGVVVFGIVIPLAVLVPLFVVANFVVAKQTEAPAASSTKLTIHVIGRQWFWAIRYPGTPAVTANEIHIPVRMRVNVVATTADVIHSFWVPQLNRKIDMIPAQTNRELLYADRPGVYRGQCAEFCGLQHAHMAFDVIADTPARFRAWLARESRPRVAPATPAARHGEQVFLSDQCASCHQIRGTAARGLVGPDLTHLAARRSLAALTIPNRRSDLLGWVRDPQHVKPGNKMPGLNLSTRDLDDVVTYLQGLR